MTEVLSQDEIDQLLSAISSGEVEPQEVQQATDQKKIKIYDLWGIPVNPKEGHPLWGVYRFKKGFRGKMVKFVGAYDFPYSPLFYNIFEYGVVWWRNVRSLLKKGKIEDSLGE